MIGQQRLIAQLEDLLNNRKFPRFSIVLGEHGAEHRDVARYVSNYMSATYVELPDVKVDTVRHMIREAYNSHALTVYCIPDADDMSVNAKNALLKVVEEVPNKAYFIMCLEDLNNTLATIQSRAVVFKMCHCSTEEVADFARSLYVNPIDVDESRIHKIAAISSTEGDVLYLQKHNVHDFYAYAEYVADNIAKVSGAEVFKFSDKLAVKDEEDKYDCRLFLKTLQAVYMDRCKSTIKWGCAERCGCMLSVCIGKYMQDLSVKGINKTMLLDNMWLEMRKIWKSQM